MANSMSARTQPKPQVGVPFRTAKEEAAGKMEKIAPYLRAVGAAGGKAVLISLRTPKVEFERLARTLDGMVLPGSPADVDPGWYHAERHARCAEPDLQREQTDFTLLDVAFARNKPVLAICYGVQLLNVYLGGTLVQDIPSELEAPLQHDWRDRESGISEPFHTVSLAADSRLAGLAGGLEARVNSSHHQSVLRPGRDLRVVAHAPDGVIEAVEFIGNDHWVVGVQWHPERLWPGVSEAQAEGRTGDAFSAALFSQLIAVAGHR